MAIKTTLLVLLTVFCSKVWAFTYMVGHGYTQCTACHISPTGGGILTEYGRELSSALISTWSYAHEAQFMNSQWSKKLEKKGIFFGGDVRGVQTYTTNPDTAQLFLMMANIQAAYKTGRFTGVVSVGQLTNPMQGGLHGNFYATQYYGMLNLPDNFVLRFGRFEPAFGLNIPDHTTTIKEMIAKVIPDFNLNMVEADYLSENWTIQADAGQTPADYPLSTQETVRTLLVDYSFLNRMRAGISYWDGHGPEISRHIIGVHGIFGFTKRFYNLSEFDLEYRNFENGAYGLSQFAYEIYKGIIPYFEYQHEQDNLSDHSTLAMTFGLGFHFFPRPHLELSGEYDKTIQASQWSDGAYLMGHYYF